MYALQEAEGLLITAAVRSPSARLCLGEFCLRHGRAAEAFAAFERAAQSGVPEAQFKLGVCFHLGIGTAAQPSRAVEWYREAAKQQDPFGMFALGLCYHLGHGVRDDVAESYQWYSAAAKLNHVPAMTNLAMIHQTHEHFFDLQKAADLYESSVANALSSDELALTSYNLGQMYAATQPVLRRAEITEAYTRGAKGGCQFAAYALGRWIELEAEPILSEAEMWFRKAAAADHLNATFRQALHMLFGAHRAVSAAPPLLRKAAERGHADSQLLLGTLLMRESTDCVAEPLGRWAEAVGRLQKAADIGIGSTSTHNDAFATATSHLAVAHLRGLGVPEDAMSGRRWLHHATEALDASAIYNQVILYLRSRLQSADTRQERDEFRSMFRNLSGSLDPEHLYLAGLCYDFGLGIDSDKRLAVAEYEKAARRGHCNARFRLGVIHETAFGAPFLTDKGAAYWYRLAARNGNLAAQNNLGLLNNVQSKVEIAYTLHSRDHSPTKEPEEDWLALASEKDEMAAMNQAFEILGGLRPKGGISPSVDHCAQIIGRAVPLLSRAAASELPAAQLFLALIHEVGVGAPRDLKQSHLLYALLCHGLVAALCSHACVGPCTRDTIKFDLPLAAADTILELRIVRSTCMRCLSSMKRRSKRSWWPNSLMTSRRRCTSACQSSFE